MAKVLRRNTQQAREVPRSPQSVRLSSGELTLADWLDFSWFYPEGFEGEEIIETARSWIVLGNGIAYKFIKSSDLPGARAEDRWMRSCRELLDNTALASAAYLGLRCLHREDEELVWESRARSAEVRPQHMPPNVEDVALVLKRLERNERLDILVQQKSVSLSSSLGRVAVALAGFHKTQSDSGRLDTLPAPDQFVRLTEERHLFRLRELLLRPGLHGDRTLTRAFEELVCYLSRFLSSAAPLFRDRLRSRRIIDCHRNIRLQNIFLVREGLDQSSRPVVIGRQLPESGQRLDDCLYDAASLAVDLQSHDERRFAECFEEEYFACFPEAHMPELYAFYKASVCIERLREVFAGEQTDEESDLMEKAEKLLSLALRLTHGLDRPGLVIFQGMKEHEFELVEQLAEVLGAECRTDWDTVPEYLDPHLPADFLSDRLLMQCRAALEAGNLVFLAFRDFSWVSKERLGEILAPVPCFQALLGPAGSSRGSGSTAADTALELPFLSDSFSLVEQVFLTLRELRLLAERQASAPPVQGTSNVNG